MVMHLITAGCLSICIILFHIIVDKPFKWLAGVEEVNVYLRHSKPAGPALLLKICINLVTALSPLSSSFSFYTYIARLCSFGRQARNTGKVLMDGHLKTCMLESKFNIPTVLPSFS
jgi:hypothetical protein